MATLIDKINTFENLPQQTVENFNSIFPQTPILFGKNSDEVEIGKILGPVNMRELRVGEEITKHLFSIVTTTTVTSANKSGEYDVNGTLRNNVMEEKEMELDPFEYKLLQYFRGSPSTFHTQKEIAEKLKISLRNVQSIIKRMKERGLVSAEHLVSIHKMEIVVNEEWL